MQNLTSIGRPSMDHSPAAQSEVEREMNRLATAKEGVHKMLDELEGRLKAVLSDGAAGQTPGATPEAITSTPLGHAIRDQTYGVESAAERMKYLLSRICV